MSDISAASGSNLNAPKDAAALRAARVVPGPVDDPGKYGVEECCVRTFWAVVETNGTFIRGRNVARVAHLGTGQYEVIFTSDVSNGVYVATIGRPGIFTEPSGEIGVALRYISNPQSHEFNKGVWVNTEDSSGNPSDRAFHLVVHTHS